EIVSIGETPLAETLLPKNLLICQLLLQCQVWEEEMLHELLPGFREGETCQSVNCRECPARDSKTLFSTSHRFLESNSSDRQALSSLFLLLKSLLLLLLW